MVKARLSRGVGNPGSGFEEGLYYIPSSPFLFDPSLSLCVYLTPCGFPSLSFPPSLSPSLSRSGGSSGSSKSVNMSVLHHYDITLALLVKQCVCLLCRWCAAEIQDVRLPRQNDACRSTARGSSGFEFRDLALGFRVRGFGFSAQSLGFGSSPGHTCTRRCNWFRFRVKQSLLGLGTLMTTLLTKMEGLGMATWPNLTNCHACCSRAGSSTQVAKCGP